MVTGVVELEVKSQQPLSQQTCGGQQMGQGRKVVVDVDVVATGVDVVEVKVPPVGLVQQLLHLPVPAIP